MLKDTCYFCGESHGDLAYDHELETSVHLKCVQEILEMDPTDPEAQAMLYLLEEQIKNEGELEEVLEVA